MTVLPPHVAHDGRSDSESGFRKRVLYLEPDALGDGLVGAAVDGPTFRDSTLRRRLHQLHRAVLAPGDDLETESRLAFIRDGLRRHLGVQPAGENLPSTVADDLRSLLDEHLADAVTLERAAGLLHAHPTHLVRAFTRRFGLPPHAYLTGKRVDAARRLLLEGVRPAEVAAATGFYDQAHLNRHFTRTLGVSPGRYARSRREQRDLSMCSCPGS